MRPRRCVPVMLPSIPAMAVMLLPWASERFMTNPLGLSGAAWVRRNTLAVFQFWRTVHRLSRLNAVGEPLTM